VLCAIVLHPPETQWTHDGPRDIVDRWVPIAIALGIHPSEFSAIVCHIESQRSAYWATRQVLGYWARWALFGATCGDGNL